MDPNNTVKRLGRNHTSICIIIYILKIHLKVSTTTHLLCVGPSSRCWEWEVNISSPRLLWGEVHFKKKRENRQIQIFFFIIIIFILNIMVTISRERSKYKSNIILTWKDLGFSQSGLTASLGWWMVQLPHVYPLISAVGSRVRSIISTGKIAMFNNCQA